MSGAAYPSGFDWKTYDYRRPGRKRYELRSAAGKHAADIWENEDCRFTWHTYDERGAGGENSVETSLRDARMACESALLRAGWHIRPKLRRARKAAKQDVSAAGAEEEE